METQVQNDQLRAAIEIVVKSLNNRRDEVQSLEEAIKSIERDMASKKELMDRLRQERDEKLRQLDQTISEIKGYPLEGQEAEARDEAMDAVKNATEKFHEEMDANDYLDQSYQEPPEGFDYIPDDLDAIYQESTEEQVKKATSQAMNERADDLVEETKALHSANNLLEETVKSPMQIRLQELKDNFHDKVADMKDRAFVSSAKARGNMLEAFMSVKELIPRIYEKSLESRADKAWDKYQKAQDQREAQYEAYLESAQNRMERENRHRRARGLAPVKDPEELFHKSWIRKLDYMQEKEDRLYDKYMDRLSKTQDFRFERDVKNFNLNSRAQALLSIGEGRFRVVPDMDVPFRDYDIVGITYVKDLDGAIEAINDQKNRVLEHVKEQLGDNGSRSIKLCQAAGFDQKMIDTAIRHFNTVHRTEGVTVKDLVFEDNDIEFMPDLLLKIHSMRKDEELMRKFDKTNLSAYLGEAKSIEEWENIDKVEKTEEKEKEQYEKEWENLQKQAQPEAEQDKETAEKTDKGQPKEEQKKDKPEKEEKESAKQKEPTQYLIRGRENAKEIKFSIKDIDRKIEWMLNPTGKDGNPLMDKKGEPKKFLKNVPEENQKGLIAQTALALGRMSQEYYSSEKYPSSELIKDAIKLCDRADFNERKIGMCIEIMKGSRECTDEKSSPLAFAYKTLDEWDEQDRAHEEFFRANEGKAAAEPVEELAKVEYRDFAKDYYAKENVKEGLCRLMEEAKDLRDQDSAIVFKANETYFVVATDTKNEPFIFISNPEMNINKQVYENELDLAANIIIKDTKGLEETLKKQEERLKGLEKTPREQYENDLQLMQPEEPMHQITEQKIEEMTGKDVGKRGIRNEEAMEWNGDDVGSLGRIAGDSRDAAETPYYEQDIKDNGTPAKATVSRNIDEGPAAAHDIPSVAAYDIPEPSTNDLAMMPMASAEGWDLELGENENISAQPIQGYEEKAVEAEIEGRETEFDQMYKDSRNDPDAFDAMIHGGAQAEAERQNDSGAIYESVNMPEVTAEQGIETLMAKVNASPDKNIAFEADGISLQISSDRHGEPFILMTDPQSNIPMPIDKETAVAICTGDQKGLNEAVKEHCNSGKETKSIQKNDPEREIA